MIAYGLLAKNSAGNKGGERGVQDFLLTLDGLKSKGIYPGGFQNFMGSKPLLRKQEKFPAPRRGLRIQLTPY